MASVSVSNLILFIAAMAIAAGVAGTMVDSVTDVSEALGAKSVDVAEDIETEVEVISDPGSGAIYDDGTTEVTILVKNTGSRTLPASADGIELLVDGQYVPPSDVTIAVVGGGEWRPGEVVRVRIDRSLDGGEHRVLVIAGDDREVLTFYT
ncbi:flagellar protein G [Salinirubellus sp. GCM10025818]|uniref:flagellar protein G n=1 Tax=Salinirubellus TaxID=2162630 RepID=UPI0030CC8DBE